MIKSKARGHSIVFLNNNWVYEDTKKLIDENRLCKNCGKSPTIEGYDGCLGYIEGIKSACCGHGLEEDRIYMG